MRETGLGEGGELQCRRGVGGQRAAVGDCGLAGIHERGALMIERPFERVAAGRLVRRRQARRDGERCADKPASQSHCDETAGGGLFNVSGLAP